MEIFLIQKRIIMPHEWPPFSASQAWALSTTLYITTVNISSFKASISSSILFFIRCIVRSLLIYIWSFKYLHSKKSIVDREDQLKLEAREIKRFNYSIIITRCSVVNLFIINFQKANFNNLKTKFLNI